MMRRSFVLGAGVVAALFLAAASADAQTRTLSMSGQWFQNRGPLVDIPINGGPNLCIGGAVQTGCVDNIRPANGGVPAAGGPVSVSGTSPAAFSIANSSAFAKAGGPANRSTVPVAGIPTVIQLASQFSFMGPGATSAFGDAMASFQANAWSNDPAQAGRLGANFSWCPPLGACVTTVLSQTYGAFQAIMRYTAGPNAFGGTMSMMMRDTAIVSINIGGSPPQVLHQRVGGITNPTFMAQVGGGAYAANRVLTLAPGPVHASYQTSTPCTSGFGQAPSPPGCGVITAQGTLLFSLPGSMNTDWGMPWTTGTVVAKNLPGPVPTQDPGTDLTAMGSDSRTPLGRGQITLVAGQLSERTPSGSNFAALDVVVMNFDSPETPLLSGPAIAAMVALMLIAGGYMARRHFATDRTAA